MHKYLRSLPKTLIVLLLSSAAIFGGLSLPVAKAESGDGVGALFRASTIGGQGVLQDTNTIPLELFPFYMSGNSMIFSDLRFYPTYDFDYGGNVGLGFRQYVEDWDRIFGISGWYDGDNTRDVYFQQAGLSLETYGQILDARSNLYFPFGPTTRQNSLSVIGGTAQFVNQNVVYSQLRSYYAAMQGFDAEVGVPIPGQFSADHAIRLYGGGYHFKDDESNSITGGYGRIQANIFSGLDAFVQVTHDNFFDTRGFVGVAWTFGPLHRSQRPESNTFARMGEHINRNVTVLAPRRESVEQALAINPATGQPYTFAHVANSAAAGGNGSVLSPFQTIAQAQAAGRDIVFVHSNEFLTGADGAIALAPGQRILGDGTDVQHFISVVNFDSFLLPHGPNPGARPTLVGAAGNSVTLASNTEFSGFSIVNASGNGIYGDGVQNVKLSTLDIHSAGAAGIQFVNGSGAILLNNVHVWNSPTGIDISGGSGNIDFRGTTIVSGSSGPSILVHNQAAASNVIFADLSINNRGGLGMAIDNSAGSVMVTGTATITNEHAATASALDIRNSSGRFLFNRVEALDPTGDAGVSLQSNTGLQAFNWLRITAHDGTALYANTTGNLEINAAGDPSQGGSITAARGTGVDIQNSNINVNLLSVTANNAPVGINLQNTTGPFTLMGNGVAGSGGTVSNNLIGIQLTNVAGPVSLNLMNLDTNGTGIRGTGVASLILQNSIVQNSTAYGMDLLNTRTLGVGNSLFTNNAAGNIRAQFTQPTSYSYTLASNTFNSNGIDNVVLTSLAGSEGSTLNFVSFANAYNNTLANTTGLRVNWNGTLNSTVTQSAFTGSGGNNTGVYITNAATNAPSLVTLTNNSFLGTGGSDTGFRVETAGSATMNVSSNAVQFNATNGTGFRMSFGAASSGTFNANTVVDSTDGATGMLFESITGIGQFTITNNTVTLANLGGLLDRGIIFSTVNDPVLILSTPETTNTVTNADQPFLAPITVQGALFINGVDQIVP